MNSGERQQRHVSVSADDRAASRHADRVPAARGESDILLCSSTFIVINIRLASHATMSFELFGLVWEIKGFYRCGRAQEYDDRQTYIVNQEASALERRSLELLNDMLPKELLTEFQNDNLRLAYSHESLAFLFADICGFTAWSRSVSAEQVLSLLQVSVRQRLHLLSSQLLLS